MRRCDFGMMAMMRMDMMLMCMMRCADESHLRTAFQG